MYEERISYIQQYHLCHRCYYQSSTQIHRIPGWWECGCRSRCPLARSPRPLPGELPGNVAMSQGCSEVLRRGSWQRQRWRKDSEEREPHVQPKSHRGDLECISKRKKWSKAYPRAVLGAGQLWWWLDQTHTLSCPAARTTPFTVKTFQFSHLGHQLLKGLVGGNLQHRTGNSEPSNRVKIIAWCDCHRVLIDNVSRKEGELWFRPSKWSGKGKDGPACCQNLVPSWSCWKCNPPWFILNAEDVVVHWRGITHHVMVLVNNNIQARSATAMADKRLQGWVLERWMNIEETLDFPL